MNLYTRQKKDEQNSTTTEAQKTKTTPKLTEPKKTPTFDFGSFGSSNQTTQQTSLIGGAQSELYARVSKLQKVMVILAFVAVFAVVFGIWSQLNANAEIAKLHSDTTQVAVATQTLSAGHVLEASDLTFTNIPNEQVVDGAITQKDFEGDTTPIGKALVSEVSSKSQLTANDYAAIGNSSSLAACVAKGSEAVTVGVDSNSGFSGMLHVGDYVRIISPSGTLGSSDMTVVSAAKIIAVGTETTLYATGDYSSITFELSPTDATLVRALQDDLTFTLISSSDMTTNSANEVVENNESGE